MRTVEEIIALLGGPEAAATRCGVGTEAIRKWRQARAIPAKHWPAVLAATGLALVRPARRPRRTPKTEPSMHAADTPPDGATGCLVLADGTVFWGRGFGAEAAMVGEICFNTGMTGYQETLTDPSYAGQVITFTFPHIGNVGTNAEDIESITPAARGLIVKQDVTEPANWRATQAPARLAGQPRHPGAGGHRHPRADRPHPRRRRAERRDLPPRRRALRHRRR